MKNLRIFFIFLIFLFSFLSSTHRKGWSFNLIFLIFLKEPSKSSMVEKYQFLNKKRVRLFVTFRQQHKLGLCHKRFFFSFLFFSFLFFSFLFFSFLFFSFLFFSFLFFSFLFFSFLFFSFLFFSFLLYLFFSFLFFSFFFFFFFFFFFLISPPLFLFFFLLFSTKALNAV